MYALFVTHDEILQSQMNDINKLNMTHNNNNPDVLSSALIIMCSHWLTVNVMSTSGHLSIHLFCSSSALSHETLEHVRSRVYGHYLWVWCRRFTGAHRQMDERRRHGHPERLFQNSGKAHMCLLLMTAFLCDLCLFHDACKSIFLCVMNWIVMMMCFVVCVSTGAAQSAGFGFGEIRRGLLSVFNRERCWKHSGQRTARHTGFR